MVIFISAGVLYVTVYMMMLIASAPFGVDATLQGQCHFSFILKEGVR